MEKRTTLQVRKEILAELKGIKKFKRETYEEVLERLLEKEKLRIK